MFEEETLRIRINQLFNKIESQLKQILKEKGVRDGRKYRIDEGLLANQILSFIEGRLHRFVRTNFEDKPTKELDTFWYLMEIQLQQIS